MASNHSNTSSSGFAQFQLYIAHLKVALTAAQASARFFEEACETNSASHRENLEQRAKALRAYSRGIYETLDTPTSGGCLEKMVEKDAKQTTEMMKNHGKIQNMVDGLKEVLTRKL